MRELLRTTDPVFASWVRAVLADADIEVFEFDTHMSVLEGSASAIPRRLMVTDDDHETARRLIDQAKADLDEETGNEGTGNGRDGT